MKTEIGKDVRPSNRIHTEGMKVRMTYPYNARSKEGVRKLRLLSTINSPQAALVSTEPVAEKSFYGVESRVLAVAKSVDLLFHSNINGLERPLVRVTGEVSMAWGNFAEDLSQLDFRDGETLPLVYTQPLDDSVHKRMIDGGLYDGEGYEDTLNELIIGEEFDIATTLLMTHIVAKDEVLGDVPVVFVEPVNAQSEEIHPEGATVSQMLDRVANVAITFRRAGYEAPLAYEDPVVEEAYEEPVYEGDAAPALVADSAYLGEQVSVEDVLGPVLSGTAPPVAPVSSGEAEPWNEADYADYPPTPTRPVTPSRDEDELSL